MKLFDAVKNLARDWRANAEIQRSRREWARSDVHRFKSDGMETLKRVSDEIRVMDERLAKLRARDRSRR